MTGVTPTLARLLAPTVPCVDQVRSRIQQDVEGCADNLVN